MKIPALAAACLAASLSLPSHVTDVGISINIGQPGFYGRIDIGGYPPPVLIYPRPVVIAPVPVAGPPIYLRVPPGHAKHWSKHCAEYGACGQRVYFVRDDWYNREYVPRYRERHDYDGDHNRHEERGGPPDRGRGEGRGEGRGHGHGHGHGHGRD